MRYADFDTTKLPIVEITINPIVPTLDEFRIDYLNVQQQLLDNHKGMVWLVKAKHLKLLPSEHRIAAGAFVKTNLSKLEAGVKAAFFIEASFWTQMTLNAILLVAKSPVPIHTCSTVPEAMNIIQSRYGLKTA